MRKERIRKNQRSWFIYVLAFIIRLFKKKITIINLTESPLNNEPAIYIANHSGASGPISFIADFPVKVVPWGTFEVKEKFKTRWKYLYYIFFRQKKQCGKVKSFILATLLSIVIRIIYGGVSLIPTYPDIRQTATLRNSIKHLEMGHPILIFPENSNEGYLDEIEVFNEGFASLIHYYNLKAKKDIPVYSVYYGKSKRKIIVDKPRFVGNLIKGREDFAKIAEEFRLRNIDLYREYIKN